MRAVALFLLLLSGCGVETYERARDCPVDAQVLVLCDGRDDVVVGAGADPSAELRAVSWEGRDGRSCTTRDAPARCWVRCAGVTR